MQIADVRPVGFWDGQRNWLVVVVETDDGLVGLGEAGIGAHQAALTGLIATFKPWLVGQDATRIEHIWQKLYRAHRDIRGGAFMVHTLAGIDMALRLTCRLAGRATASQVQRMLEYDPDPPQLGPLDWDGIDVAAARAAFRQTLNDTLAGAPDLRHRMLAASS